jgi:hypothetical protein
MDDLEASMTKEQNEVRACLAGLALLRSLDDDGDLATAAARFARYGDLKARMLALSRENTNVRSLILSLNQRRDAMIRCVGALGPLKQAILDERVAGVPDGRGPTR